ncbi:MAG: ribosome small subunit-dependent GTPase A [Burkholderiales bacterium]
MSSPQALHHGLVVGAFGRQYLIELAEGKTLTCTPRGKRSTLACGDRVEIVRTSADQGVVEAVDPRSTLLYRSDQFRQKLIAANVTQIIVVLAVVPSFYEELLNRCTAAAEHQRLSLLIVLNKIDLDAQGSPAIERLGLYSRLGYQVLPMSAKRDVSPLRPFLSGHLSVLVGQSGMGKSTLINALVPGAAAATAEFSNALDSGRHTTTHARLYRLDGESALIDSPGLQEFGLHHLNSEEVADAFRELRAIAGQCRFRNCRHLVEPGCAVASAVEQNTIDPRRLEAFRKIIRENEAGKRH